MGSNNFIYTGIDILPPPEDLADYPLFNVNASYIQADATNLRCLEEDHQLRPNTFDLVILRHPNFIDESEMTFKKILRSTIPYFLITGGALLVSVYDDAETIFFGKEERFSANSYFINKLYQKNGECHDNEKDNILGKIAASDRWMFCFINKFNKSQLTIRDYEINNLVPEAIPHLERIVTGLGGHFINSHQFKCAEEYALDTDPVIRSYGDIRLITSASTPSYFLANDSAVLSLISTIKRELLPFKQEATKPFFKAFDNGQYNRALRIACTSNTQAATSIVSVLIRYIDPLGLNPNESAGNPLRNAFDLAEEKNRHIYTLLSRVWSDDRKNIVAVKMPKP
ncbi:MAG: class I SAM-dependent methyltransferase [Gammaproteobacteria bacterium]|nr:class I SAM-dependent methyltransferase [Gammaproteobacteria bacterium]